MGPRVAEGNSEEEQKGADGPQSCSSSLGKLRPHKAGLSRSQSSWQQHRGGAMASMEVQSHETRLQQEAWRAVDLRSEHQQQADAEQVISEKKGKTLDKRKHTRKPQGRMGSLETHGNTTALKTLTTRCAI